MKIQKDSNYKPSKMPLWARVGLPLIFLAGASLCGIVEGTVEGLNYKSLERSAMLKEKFEKQYQETMKNKYIVENKDVKSYLNFNKKEK